MPSRYKAYGYLPDTEENRELYVAEPKTSVGMARAFAIYRQDDVGVLVPDYAAVPDPIQIKPVDTLPFSLREYQLGPVKETAEYYMENRGVFLRAPCGCIHGDAIINVNRAGKGFKVKLRDLVARLNDPTARYAWDPSIATYTQRREEDGTIRLGKIAAAWFSGTKPVYKIIAGKYSTKATSEHPFLTDKGWKKLEELTPGDSVYVRDPERKATRNKARKKSYIRRRVVNHPKATAIGIVNEHQLVMEAHLNALTYSAYISRLKNNDLADLKFIDTSTHAVHHKDRNDQNNELDNLVLLTHEEHHKLHSEEDNGAARVLFKSKLEQIESIEFIGEEETFDIEVEDDPHNFLADDFVVHNTGKTVMALAISELCSFDAVVILVDQVRLAEQWKERIEEFLPGAAVGVFHGKALPIENLKKSSARFKIVVVQSATKMKWEGPQVECDLLIADEAHVFSAPTFSQAIYNFDYARSLALTATDDRRDGLEWVFKIFLAEKTVEVQGKTMSALAMMPRIQVASNHKDFRPAYCQQIQKWTWKNKCEKCEFYEDFPVCGQLPRSGNFVRWMEDKAMWTPMLKDLCYVEEYREQFKKVIERFYDWDRNLLVFCQFKDPLKELSAHYKELWGPHKVGLFVSGTKNPATELQKQVTFTTYAIAQKGIDCPWKDASILMSPMSDIRQTVGRITRVKPGKKRPIIFDPIVENNPLLLAQAKKRAKHYKALGFDIKE